MIRNVFRFIKIVIMLIFFVIRSILSLISNLLNYFVDYLNNKLRFSITFKITVTYAVFFILVSIAASIGIILSYNYFNPTNLLQEQVILLSTLLIIFNTAGVITILIAGSQVSRRLLSPIHIMTKTVKEMSVNELDKRLDVYGVNDELKDLAQTFNDLMDRLQLAFEQQNQFVADASHELRTPISVIKGYSDLIARWGKEDRQVLEESIAAIQDEVENMKELLANLLFLARGDKNAQPLEIMPFYLNEVIEEIMKETLLIDTKHKIINQQNEKILLEADRKLIKQAIRILMDNSLKYTPAGGKIILNGYTKADKAIISLEDSGIGISPQDLPYIFNRFYRVDKSRNKLSGGTGLGLAIAKWIVNKHNGNIKVWSNLGAGTAIRIELPLTFIPSEYP